MKNPIPSDVADQAPAAGAELSRAADELNVMLLEVEDVFCDWKLGVTVSVDLGCIDARGDALRLRFRKYQQGWGLFVEAASDKPLPLTAASRAVRLCALEKIPELSRALLAETRRQTQEMRAATEKARQFIIATRTRGA